MGKGFLVDSAGQVGREDKRSESLAGQEKYDRKSSRLEKEVPFLFFDPVRLPTFYYFHPSAFLVALDRPYWPASPSRACASVRLPSRLHARTRTLCNGVKKNIGSSGRVGGQADNERRGCVLFCANIPHVVYSYITWLSKHGCSTAGTQPLPGQTLFLRSGQALGGVCKQANCLRDAGARPSRRLFRPRRLATITGRH